MHLIFFDRVLCPTANYLMAGATQLVLAMAEAGWADPGLLLDDPLGAVSEVSRDLTLKNRLTMIGRGRRRTAVEVQRGLADLAGEFVSSGLADNVVPGAAAIVECWQQTLEMLARRDLAALMQRCDWALKYLLLERMRGRKGLSWADAEVKSLDFRYSSLDPEEGLFWQMASAGRVEGVPPPERVERFFSEPPDDTRAYLRAHVLRRFGENVADVDWADIRLRLPEERFWHPGVVLRMPDPTAFGREAAETILARCRTVEELAEAFGAEEASSSSSYSGWGWGGRRGWYS
jgi:proteasome accessory factor A